MYKYGFEREYFVFRKNKPVLIEYDMHLPYDGCGWLAEARGEPDNDILKAAYLLQYEEHNMFEKAKRAGVDLRLKAFQKMPKDVLAVAPYQYEKKRRCDQCIYVTATDFLNDPDLAKPYTLPDDYKPAGLHVSVTNEETITMGKRQRTVYNMWDFVQFFKFLDVKFWKEIKKGQRRPGWYELKAGGRIEYRSLPATIDIFKVVDAIYEYMRL